MFASGNRDFLRISSIASSSTLNSATETETRERQDYESEIPSLGEYDQEVVRPASRDNSDYITRIEFQSKSEVTDRVYVKVLEDLKTLLNAQREGRKERRSISARVTSVEQASAECTKIPELEKEVSDMNSRISVIIEKSEMYNSSFKGVVANFEAKLGVINGAIEALQETTKCEIETILTKRTVSNVIKSRPIIQLKKRTTYNENILTKTLKRIEELEEKVIELQPAATKINNVMSSFDSLGSRFAIIEGQLRPSLSNSKSDGEIEQNNDSASKDELAKKEDAPVATTPGPKQGDNAVGDLHILQVRKIEALSRKQELKDTQLQNAIIKNRNLFHVLLENVQELSANFRTFKGSMLYEQSRIQRQISAVERSIKGGRFETRKSANKNLEMFMFGDGLPNTRQEDTKYNLNGVNYDALHGKEQVVFTKRGSGTRYGEGENFTKVNIQRVPIAPPPASRNVVYTKKSFGGKGRLCTEHVFSSDV